MEESLIILLGTMFSCIIISIIVFRFFDETYNRMYENKLVYSLLPFITSVIMICTNRLDNPYFNFAAWIILLGVSCTVFYNNNEKTKIQRIFETLVLILLLTVCETLGYLVLEFIIWKFEIYINNNLMLLEGLKITFSKISMLMLYYMIIVRIWKQKHIRVSSAQCIIYGLIVIYSMLNLSLILIVLSGKEPASAGEKVLLLINIFGIIFVDLFFLYFTKFTEENEQLKVELKLLEQQANLQYSYYVSQEEKYKESVSILHDVNKHLNMMENIYKVEKTNEARKYVSEIQELLQPLVPQQYTNCTILNILLNDKKRSAILHKILLTLEINEVNLEFMKPIEITTVFGNLLDNAMEACKNITKDRFVDLKLGSYNGFISIQIINSFNQKLKWVEGRPISNKGKNHGIGIANVEKIIKKYNGHIALEEEARIFKCSIVLNR